MPIKYYLYGLRHHLDISTLQVFINNLCTIHKVYLQMEYKDLCVIFSAIHEIRPTHVAVCWDMGQSTFRNDMFDGYKQNRSAPPEELIPQFDYVKEISEQFGFVNIGV